MGILTSFHTGRSPQSVGQQTVGQKVRLACALITVMTLILTLLLFAPHSAAAAENPSAAISIGLAYGDNADHPSGITVHPGTSFAGNIMLNMVNMSGKPTKDSDNVTVTLRVPKDHVSSVSIPEFVDKVNNVSQTHTISSMTVDGDDDVVTIHWDHFNHAAGLIIPFTISVANGTTPEGTVIQPTATITSDQNPTPITSNTLTATAHYPALQLTKSVNGQKNEATVVGAASTATASDGTEYIPEDGAAAVTFNFSVGADDGSIRAMSMATITDMLPTYTDYQGHTRRAYFNAAANPGWTLSTDGTTLTWTKSGDSNALASSIPALRLGFPGLPLTHTDSYQQDSEKITYHYGTAANSAILTTKIANPASGETGTTTSSSIDLKLTTGEIAAHGAGFLKLYPYKAGNFPNLNVADTVANKSGDFQWHFFSENRLGYAMGNVVLHDEHGSTLCGTGSDMCGPDARLHVTGIDEVTINDKTTDVISIVSEVRAYKQNGQYDVYHLANTAGKPSVTFDSSTTYTGFSLVFNPDWTWQPGTHFSVIASSYLLDPNSVHWVSPSTASNNKITNRAAVIGNTLAETINNDGTISHEPVGTSYSKSWDNYLLTQYTQKMSVGVELYDMGAKTQHIGNTPLADVQVSGTLDPGVDYTNLRAILLLPAGMVWQNYSHTLCVYGAPSEGCSTFVTGTKIVDNYKDTGQTAVIFSLDQAYAKKMMNGSSDNSQAWIFFYAKITQDSTPGTNANVLRAFITSDNAPDPGTESGFSSYKASLPPADGKGSYPDTYKIGAHATISASSYGYTVPMNAGIQGSQTIENDTASDANGIEITPASTFTYHLNVSNFGDSAWSDLVLFDALPSTAGGSDFDAQLTGWPTAPSGYTLLYATDPSVATMSEDAATTDASLWKAQSALSSPTQVTAIKMVPSDTTTVTANSTISLSLPMRAKPGISATPDISDYVPNPDGGVGLIARRDATNTFSFSAKQGSATLNWKQANAVYARLNPLAGFVVEKISDLGKALPEAKLTFSGTTGSTVIPSDTRTTGDTGVLTYYGLNAGTQTLAEDEAPKGYAKADGLTISVSKTRTSLTMTCTTTTSSGKTSACTGSGTPADPFRMTDPKLVTSLPDAGGRLAMLLLCLAMTFLLALLGITGCILLRPRKREH